MTKQESQEENTTEENNGGKLSTKKYLQELRRLQAEQKAVQLG